MDDLQELDAFALTRDLPEFRLRAGDFGGIIATEDDGRFIVEIPDSAGGTYALLTIETGSLLTKIRGQRTDCYSEIRSEGTIPLEKVEMSRIGG